MKTGETKRPTRAFYLAGALSCFTALLPSVSSASPELETVVVTGSKQPEPVLQVPATISVVSGDELRARNASDLAGALNQLGGVDVGAGGDDGPASTVPSLWGLREFDAFLLVVDGVPWGGAFNPALATLDLTNVERIEVLRGAAPVMYGATSFVGVIQVIHRKPENTPAELTLTAGLPGNVGGAFTLQLPGTDSFKQSLSVDANHTDYRQNRTTSGHVHFLYRNSLALGSGQLHMDVDGTSLQQGPASPIPREDTVISPRVPIDANINPTDARRDKDRLAVSVGFDQPLSVGVWSTLLAVTRTSGHNTQGFLRDDFADDGVTVNADGFRQGIGQTDLYFDTRIAMHPSPELAVTTGADWLHGKGEQHSDNFEYAVSPDGSNAPSSASLHIDESTFRSDQRDFLGVYAQADWMPVPRLDVVAGARYNWTDERSHGEEIDRNAPPGTPANIGDDKLSESRGAVFVGANWSLLQPGPDKMSLYANYRDTYKPAAVDFGPEAESDILQPETARSYEVGLKGKQAAGRLEWQASAFLMDFSNLVIAENIGGLPALANAGTERFKGFELESQFHLSSTLTLAGSYAYHDARFTNYERDTGDGTFEQLAGKRLELSPQHLAALGLVYQQPAGFIASAVAHYVGSRYLDKSNTALAPHYVTVDAGVGYHFDRWTVRLDGTNITDRRDPVTESELGEGSFYLLQGATVLLSARMSFH
jgi:iron complex outermembrane recepter protein